MVHSIQGRFASTVWYGARSPRVPQSYGRRRRASAKGCCVLVVPALYEHYKKLGLKHHKIVGVTTLDVVRANKFTSSLTGSSMRDAQIPVIGGSAGVITLPLFSQCLVGPLVQQIKWRIWARVWRHRLVLAPAATWCGSASLWICSSQSCALRDRTRGAS